MHFAGPRTVEVVLQKKVDDLTEVNEEAAIGLDVP